MRNAAFLLVTLALGTPALALAGPTQPSAKAVLRTVEVASPVGETAFPRGPGSDLANEHCVICHSVGMVRRQPPLSFGDWKAEVAKMRAAYGAPLPADKVDEVARYLTTINGKP
jgi:mono/diheme cytochrome c family protein